MFRFEPGPDVILLASQAVPHTQKPRRIYHRPPAVSREISRNATALQSPSGFRQALRRLFEGVSPGDSSDSGAVPCQWRQASPALGDNPLPHLAPSPRRRLATALRRNWTQPSPESRHNPLPKPDTALSPCGRGRTAAGAFSAGADRVRGASFSRRHRWSATGAQRLLCPMSCDSRPPRNARPGSSCLARPPQHRPIARKARGRAGLAENFSCGPTQTHNRLRTNSLTAGSSL